MDSRQVRPSETVAGRSWLNNFAPTDQELAARLADSLDIWDHTDALHRLQAFLRDKLNETDFDFPAVVVPIRSQEDLGELPSGHSSHIAYETFEPGMDIPVLAGSEADVGAALRDIVAMSEGKLLPPDTPLSELKAQRVKSILLVTDYSGSGTQALRFAENFRRNRTIGSWMSYHRISIRVITFATSAAQDSPLLKTPWLALSALATARSASSAPWTPATRNAIIRLCEKYSIEQSRYPALGYKQSFGLYATNMRVPNNLPQILLRDDPNWFGLFPDRSMRDSFYSELRDYHAHQTLEKALADVGALDLAMELQRSTRPLRATRAIATLQLVDYGMDPDEVDQLLDLPPETRELLRASLISMGFVDNDGRVTREGRQELRDFRRRSTVGVSGARSSKPPIEYVPTQLR